MILEILPLLIFTTCSGIAVGAYILNTLCVSGHGKLDAEEKPWLFPLVCLILLGVGLLGTLTHLGQPFRFINGMANPASMISQEAYWAMAFGAVLVVDLIFTKVKSDINKIVRWIGTAIGAVLMVITSLAYFDSLGLAGWNTSSVIPFFVFGDLAAGAAVALLLAPEKFHTDMYKALIAACIAWAVSVLAYGIYLSAIGIDGAIALVIGAVIGPVATIALSAIRLSEKVDDKTAAIAVVALSAIGLIIVRIAFFLAGMGA